MFEKVTQSHSRFNSLDKLVVTVHSVRMPEGCGRRDALKTLGRPFSIMAYLKRSIVEVKAEENCLAHALIIEISRLNNDSNYNSYRRGYKIRPVVQNLLETVGMNLDRGGPELIINVLKVMCMKMQHLVFPDSVSFLPFLLRKLPEVFDLTSSKSWYPHRPKLPEIAQGMHTHEKTNTSRTWSGAQQQPKSKNIQKNSKTQTHA